MKRNLGMGLKNLRKKNKRKVKRKQASVVVLHHKSSKKNRKFKRKSQRNFFYKLGRKIGYVFLVIVFFTILIFSAIFIFNLIKSLKKAVVKEDKVDVIHELYNIPTFPNSYSVYQFVDNTKTIAPLKAEGIYVYKKPSQTSIPDVYRYYKDNLVNNGWTFVKFVPFETDIAKLGQYWINEDKSIGLQIVVDEQYIWYRKLTVKQAKTLLQDEAKSDAMKRKIVLSQEDQFLLPDFPWQLQVPGEYIIRYQNSDLDSWRKLIIYAQNKDDYVILEPIAKFEGKPFEDYLNQWLDKYHKEWQLINTNADFVKGKSCIQVEMKSNEKEDDNSSLISAVVWLNTKNSIVYILFDEKGKTNLFNFVLQNIKETPKTRFDAH